MSQRDRTEGRHVTASGRERAAGEKRQIRIMHGSRQMCTDEATGSQSNTATPKTDRRSRYIPRLDKALDGGPQDPSLLISFEAHVANEIWSHRNKSEDRGRLKCHQRPAVIRDWPRPHYLDEPWVTVRESGLAHLSTSMHGHIDNPLLSAFVERWQPETNSFHMPWGEMTITLHDVWKILRLRIDGDPVVIQTSRNRQEEINELSTSLYIDYSRLREEMKRGNIKFKTLREAGRSCADGVMTTTAYLLYLLSATVFVDKSADRALDRFFPLLLNYDEIQNYAWGTTVLAYLYRRLGEASRSECRQLSGCTTLLQSWIYEYFPLLRPARAMRYRSGEPRSLRWKTDFTPNQDDEALFDYRIALDRMTAHQVEWMPYGPIDLTTSHLRVSRYHGPISCLSISEPYMPDRVSRQFGRVQGVPGQVIVPERAYRPADPARYIVTYPRAEWAWARRHSTHTIELEQMGPPAIAPFDHQSDYLLWYYPRTHLMLCHPEHEISREHPRPGPSGDYITVERINRALPIMHHLVEPRRHDLPPVYWEQTVRALNHLTLFPTFDDESVYQQNADFMQQDSEEEDQTWKEDDDEDEEGEDEEEEDEEGEDEDEEDEDEDEDEDEEGEDEDEEDEDDEDGDEEEDEDD